MSGHMMITSRGSRVVSAASRWRTASRITSTCRDRPWHEWIRRLRSAGSSGGRGSGSPALGSRWRRPIGPDVRLDAIEQRQRAPGHGPVLAGDGATGGQDQLHLAGVTAPRAQERVGGQGRGGIIGSPYPRRRARQDRSDLVPQGSRGMQQEQVHVPPDGHRLQHRQVAGRQPGQAEQRKARRQVDQPLRSRRLAPMRPGSVPPGCRRRYAGGDGATAPPARRRSRPPRPVRPAAQARIISGRCTP